MLYCREVVAVGYEEGVVSQVQKIDPALAQRVLDQIKQDEAISFLQALVRVPSVNPPGDVRDAIKVCNGRHSM